MTQNAYSIRWPRSAQRPNGKTVKQIQLIQCTHIIINSLFVDCTEISKQKKKRRKYEKKRIETICSFAKVFLHATNYTIDSRFM